MTNAHAVTPQPIRTSPFVTGLSHVGILCHDLDRLAAFYAEVFDATIVDVPAPPGTRAALVQLSSTAGLALMERLDGGPAARGTEMLDRGRIDHVAFDAPGPAALEAMRVRLIDRGASDGSVHDYGPLLSVGFTDPEGMQTEVVWVRDPSLSGAHPPIEFSGSLLDLEDVIEARADGPA